LKEVHFYIFVGC